MRVMIVSEDAAVRSRAAAALEAREGIDVTEVVSASAAHRLLAEEDVDVIVMDGDMRPEGGYSVIYELRAAAEMREEQTRPTIVLMDRAQDRWLAHWAGADEALLKPVNPFHLADLVAGLHERSAGADPAGDPGATSGRELEMDAPSELDRADAPSV
jgi:DNA-binding response OmpR family regulator